MKSKKRTKKKSTGSQKNQELAGSRVRLKFKKHLLPPLAGLVVAILVFGFFNSQLLSGKIAYYLYDRNIDAGSLNSQLVASPVDKNAPPKIIINDINVKAPIVFDVQTVNEGLFQKALRSGVVHYPGTAQPGQAGNVVVFGHSSGQWWAPGDYKFIFTHLDKLQQEDKIFVEYQGVRYIYKVFGISVVKPTDLSVLNQGGSNILTLITCTPVGTATNRLIIKAQQIVPNVSNNRNFNQAAQKPAEAQGALPSNSAPFWRDFLNLF